MSYDFNISIHSGKSIPSWDPYIWTKEDYAKAVEKAEHSYVIRLNATDGDKSQRLEFRSPQIDDNSNGTDHFIALMHHITSAITRKVLESQPKNRG